MTAKCIRLDDDSLMWIVRDQFGHPAECWPIPKQWARRIEATERYPQGAWWIMPPPDNGLPAPCQTGFYLDAKDVVE